MDHDIKVICTSCGAELIPDKENKIYRCMHCGVAYGSSILFDRNAGYKARKALEESEFNEADVWFRCVLMTCSYDFDALKGRILCAGKWRDFEDVTDASALSTVRIKNVRDRIEEALVRAWDSDRKYFMYCKELIDTLEKLRQKINEISPIQEKIDKYKYNLEHTALRISGEGVDGYEAVSSSIDEMYYKIEPLQKEKKELETGVANLKKSLEDFEKSR